jgi:hypothetical protein
MYGVGYQELIIILVILAILGAPVVAGIALVFWLARSKSVPTAPRVCANCGHVSPAAGQYCPACGARMET